MAMPINRLAFLLLIAIAFAALYSSPPAAASRDLALHRRALAVDGSSGSSSKNASADNGDQSHGAGKRRLRNYIIGFVAGFAGGIVSGTALASVVRCTVAALRAKNRPRVTIFMPSVIRRREDIAFLERDDGLEGLEVIGRGGSGEVYKASIPASADGREPEKLIAVKRVRPDRPPEKGRGGAPELAEEESRLLDKWMRQVRSEIVTVGHVRHRNLLPLAAHVARPDGHLLVYEFMKNGSLHNALLRSNDGREEFPWLARLRVAVGVAAGLEYLHDHQRPPIVHRDLKPDNVLLDDGMEARIADFGLARAMPGTCDGAAAVADHLSLSRVAGTVGYMAPELPKTMRYTTASDVYSMGVVMAALVVGREPSDRFFAAEEEMVMVSWVRNAMASATPEEAICQQLRGARHEEEQMLLLLKVACFCTADDPAERPAARDVAAMISQIK